MEENKPPAPEEPASSGGLSHGEVLDFVTGGAAAWADRFHGDKAPVAPKRQRGAKRDPALSSRLSVTIHKELHQRLKSAAVERKTSVGELLDQLLRDHL